MDDKQVIARHRFQARPVFPSVQVSRLAGFGGHAANRLRIGGEHRLGGDYRRQQLQVSKHILPAAQPDHIADEVIAVDGHQWFVPDLVEHRQRREPGVLGLARHERARSRQRDRFRAGQAAELLDRARDVGQSARRVVEHRDAESQ